jgi:transcriptional regulator with XRE-family HTH domain
MSRFKGLLGAVLREKREEFKQRLDKQLSKKKYEKYGARREIAQACGVHEMTLQSWKEGRSFPEDEHIAALATFFGLSVEEFLGAELANYYRMAQEYKQQDALLKKQKELAKLWGHAMEYPQLKSVRRTWTEKNHDNWEAQVEELEQECKAAGIFDETGEIKPEFLADYTKGKRSAHRL